jgi:phenylacetate-CoA ligase
MSWIHTNLILPLAEPERHAGLGARLRAIRRFEKMPESAQREEQQQRLRKILQHAYDTVPHYRKLFDDAGFNPSTARTDVPLSFPALTREHLRGESKDLLSTAYAPGDLRHSVTGGTTSTPAKFQRDLEGLRDKTALNLQLNAWAGYNAGDSVMMLWGAHRDLVLQPGWRWKLYEEKILRRIPAPSGVLTEEILERFRQRYEESRPKVLYAYTSVLAAFASYLRAHGIRHRPEVLIVTAEPLNQDSKNLIESVFGRQVYDHYGSRDVGMIASQCSAHDLLHFHPWACHVEFEPIGPTPDGTAYRLLVTDLLNYGQPFIRYDTGDCVTLSEQRCQCGRWFPSARKVFGRITDGLFLPNGGIVPGPAFTLWLGALSGNLHAIAQVQFVQKTRQHLHLRYALLPGATSAQHELERIRAGIDELAGVRLTWTFEQVAEISRESSGKLRLCISEIPAQESSFAHSLLTREQP